MNDHAFRLRGAALSARPSGALWWGEAGVLAVSDLHLCKSERMARRGGPMLPPYEVAETLMRLEAEIAALAPAHVVCLGDSFDDCAAAEALGPEMTGWLTKLMAGRRWTWIEGNHDPGPLSLGGAHMAELTAGPLVFRHIARPEGAGAAEISGHYHPKARVSGGGSSLSRPCFLIDGARVVMPAFGTYTGGLDSTAEVLVRLMSPDALAVLTGRKAIALPMPREAPKPQPPYRARRRQRRPV